jgi:hypothetical protein
VESEDEEEDVAIGALSLDGEVIDEMAIGFCGAESVVVVIVLLER